MCDVCDVQIGDYLLTLPQQLEPFTSQESPALSAALKQSHLPFPPTDGKTLLQDSVNCCQCTRICEMSIL